MARLRDHLVKDRVFDVINAERPVPFTDDIEQELDAFWLGLERVGHRCEIRPILSRVLARSFGAASIDQDALSRAIAKVERQLPEPWWNSRTDMPEERWEEN